MTVGSGNRVGVNDLKIWPGGTLSLREDSVLNVGAASLGGTLEFLLSPTTTPQLGNEFVVFSALGGVAGTFSSTILPQLAEGLRWAVDYEATSVSLRVAPAFTADFDGDGDVDSGDLSQWAGDFGVNALSDADDDGDSDGADFLAWQRQLGSPSVTVAAKRVPEPGALALISLAGCGLALVRERHR